MQLSDNSTNAKVVLLYVNQFRWFDQHTTEQMGGHLKQKRVYRAVFNSDTGSYKVVYAYDRSSQAIILTDLQQATDQKDGYTANISILTKANMVDFEICEEDLDNIIKWKDHKDLNQIIEEGRIRMEPSPEQNFIQELFRVAKPNDMMREYTESSRELFSISPLHHDGLLDLIEHIKGNKLGSIEAMNLTMDEYFGPGINIGNAYEAMARYTCEDRKMNLDPADLLLAASNLITEYIRASYE